jgi:hypothetical protein
MKAGSYERLVVLRYHRSEVTVNSLSLKRYASRIAKGRMSKRAETSIEKSQEQVNRKEGRRVK